MTDVFTRLLPEVHDQGVRLGRHDEKDPRSKNFKEPTKLLDRFSLTRYPILWQRFSPILDQGQLGSCTGNAMAGALGCAPFSSNGTEADKFDEAFAVKLYSRATVIDKFAGSYPPEDTGSSGLAVAKAARELGLIKSYTWAFSTSGLISALRNGPVIVGVPWYDGFFYPDADGFVWPAGSTVGGHEFLIRGFYPGGPDGSGYFWCDNSWSTSWGKRGSFHITVKTWDRLRAQGADVTVPKR